MITRQKYIKKIEKWIDKDLIKVITGIRRSGKTYFMRQIIDVLINQKNIKQNNIIYINKEDLKFDFIRNYKDLYDYINQNTKNKKGKKYIFIDEIQDIDQWEKAIRSFLSVADFDIYITGSNSNLLSSELSSFLTGRYVEFHIYPLTFEEFLIFRGDNKKDIKSEFKSYLKYGGFPAIHKMEFEDEIIYSYLSGIFNSILLKDIVTRYDIRNSSLLFDIFKFLSDNIGNIVSSKKIVDYLKKDKINISLDTLREYLLYFQYTFLLNKIQRYDLKGKKLLDIFEKYYLSDLGFRSYLLGYSEKDISQSLENLVFIELLSRGYEVKIGKIGTNEIDFIAKRNGIIEYYQVTYLLSDSNTIEREFGNLKKIDDNYLKVVLSLDEYFQNDYDGIKRYNIIDWCLGKNL